MNRKVKRSITLILAVVLVLAMLPMPMAQAATLKQGSSGSTVRYLQLNLIGLGYLTDAADSSFGPKTTAAVKAFQADYGLKVDGIAGQATQTALRNAMVRLQVELKKLGYAPGTADGYYGNKTKSAIAAFQQDCGLNKTGVMDQNTLNALDERSGGLRAFIGISKGSSGNQVRYMQMDLIGLGYLTDTADGKYGPKTEAAIRSFQGDYGLTADGSAGRTTMTALKNVVVALQSDLTNKAYYSGIIDGIYGNGTRTAVSSYQRNAGINANGVAGPATMNKLYGYSMSSSEESVEGAYKIDVKLIRQDNDNSIIYYGYNRSRKTTVATSGCGGATLAMVLNTFLGTQEHTALGIMQWFADKGLYYGEGTAQKDLRNYAGIYNVNSLMCDTADDLISNIKAGRLVIALVKDKTGHGYFTKSGSSGHYVVVSGYQIKNGVEQVYINNPLGYKKTGWFNINDLMDNCINEWEGYNNSFVVFYK